MFPVQPPEPTPGEIAAGLRLVIGQLVRRVRTADTLLPRLAATLGYLDREGSMTTSDLAIRQHVRQQSMAATLAELDARGYIDRRPHPSDRRKILISISEAGRGRLDDERHGRSSWLNDAITEQLSPAEQSCLASSVQLLGRLIEYDPGSERPPRP